MRQSPQTSFQTMRPYIRRVQPKLKQQITINHSRVLRVVKGVTLQRCIDCSGIPRMTPDGNVTGFYSISMRYPHKKDCAQEGRF